jgi:hypothetical protein
MAVSNPQAEFSTNLGKHQKTTLTTQDRETTANKMVSESHRNPPPKLVCMLSVGSSIKSEGRDRAI